MSLTPRWALGGLVLLLAAPLAASLQPGEERPPIHVPVRPVSRQDLDRREAQRLYGVGLLHERKNRLVEAIKAFEAARRLDPESGAILRSLIPLYLALDRQDEAQKACARAIQIDPDDFQTAGLYARQLRGSGKNGEAIKVLSQAVKSKRLDNRPEMAVQVWFDLGSLQERTGDLAGAEKSFRQMAAILNRPAPLMEAAHIGREEINVQAADIYERIGRVCLRAKATSRAIEAFEQAQKKDTNRAARLALNLARVYEGQRKYREALAQIETYLRTQPQGMEAYELKIGLQRKLGRQADVVGDLETASGHDPNNQALKLLLAREYKKAGAVRKAEAAYQALLEKSVAIEVYRGLLELYRDQGASGASQVLALFNRAVYNGMGDDKRRGNPSEAAKARAMLNVLRDDKELVLGMLTTAIARMKIEEGWPDGPNKVAFATRGFLATLAARTNQLDQAEQLYRSCLDRPGGLRELEAEVYSGLLRVLKLRNKHEAIAELCKQGLKTAQATNRVLFHTELGRAQQYLGNNKEAVAAYAASVADAGKGQVLQCKRLWIDALSVAGQHDKALAECQLLLKEYNQGGELREVRSALSQVYSAMGKHDLADRQMQLILESDPNDATTNNDLGYGWADRNIHLDEAERMVRKAIDLDRKQRASGAVEGEGDDNAAYVDSLGWVLFRRGKLTEARKELEKASKLPTGDDDPVVWDHLGDVCFRMKEVDRAVAAWKKALALYDTRARRMQTDRYKEIKDKIEQVKP
jgi:tetratricopeptide (TPR) repeat protein